jgi:hypothetical protein
MGLGIVAGMIDIVHSTRLSSVEKVAVFQNIIRLLDKEGWGTQAEAMGLDPIFDLAMRGVYGRCFDTSRTEES